MALPPTPTPELNLLSQINGNAYDESTNPYGMALGGHRQNFPPSVQAVATIGNWTAEVAPLFEAWAAGMGDAVQAAQDAADAAAQSAQDAALFDPSNYYPKATIDAALATKADAAAMTEAFRDARYHAFWLAATL